jgi:hypothetical protein
MTDAELLERLRRIDPLHQGVPVEPAHSARAFVLKERIMSTDLGTRPSEPLPVADPAEVGRLVAPRSRRRWFVTAGFGSAAAVVALVGAAVLPGPGRPGAALAWTAIPRAAGSADAELARQACVVPAPEPAPDEERSARASGDPAPLDAAPAAPPLTAPTSPDRLAPLAALDLRGQGGLAVFVDDVNTTMCLLRVIDGKLTYFGMAVFDTAAQPDGLPAVEAGMTTGVGSDLAVSMVTGQVGPAARVELVVPGVEPITATVVKGRFAAWWPEPGTGGATSLEGSIRVRAFAADGTQLTEFDWSGGRTAREGTR